VIDEKKDACNRCYEIGILSFTRVPNLHEYIRLEAEKTYSEDGYGFTPVYKVVNVVHTPQAVHNAELLVKKESRIAGDYVVYNKSPDITRLLKDLGHLLTWDIQDELK
jgi:hypothetical protein